MDKLSWSKALGLALVGIVGICGLTYFNSAVMLGTPLVGNHLPVGVYGPLIIFLIAVNGLLFYLGRRVAFDARELAVALCLVLAVCAIPGYSLLAYLIPAAVAPHHFERTEPGWADSGLVERTPAGMLVDVRGGEEEHERVVLAWLSGDAPVPWDAWMPALAFWFPVVIMIWVAQLGLSLVFHRQWSRHEHLPYPIATFTNALLPDAGEARGGIMRDRLFWLGTLAVGLIHLNNFAAEWSGDAWIAIPLEIDMRAVLHAWELPEVRWWTFRFFVYFSGIGFAYFLTTDVSFSVGIAPLMFLALINVATLNGFIINDRSMFGPNPARMMVFGAYLGMMVMIAYTGRHYYRQLLRRAVFLPSREDVDPNGVFGFRLAAVAAVAAIIYVSWRTGLDLLLTTVFIGIVLMVFVVMSRIIAETGLFFNQVFWRPGAILIGLMGARAIGPDTIVIIFLLTTVLMINPREALMPYLTNALKVADDRQVHLRPVSGWVMAAMLIGLGLATVVALTQNYKYGASPNGTWNTDDVARGIYDTALQMQQRLDSQGVLAEAQQVSGLRRLLAINPADASLVWFTLIGFGLFMLTALARLRLPWWPLHPVAFLVWTTYPVKRLYFSFLIGWALKVAVTRYGGVRVYNRLKPLMIGVIAGEMLGAVLPSAIGALYALLTGDITNIPRFMVMPP